MTQTRDIGRTPRSTSSDMVIEVVPTLIMKHTPSMKIRKCLLVVGWITRFVWELQLSEQKDFWGRSASSPGE